METSSCCGPAAEAAPGLDSAEGRAALAAGCKALGHPVRVEIVRTLLATGTCITGDLVEHFDLAQSTVSQHLKVLKDAGLVVGEVDGPRRCYCVNGEALARLKELVASL